MAKWILPGALWCVASAFVLFGDHLPGGVAAVAARDCPHGPQQLFVPATGLVMGSRREERDYATCLR